MTPAPRAHLSGLLVLAALASACDRERPSSAGEPTRSESASLTLPTDPAALAAALGVSQDSLRAAGQERYYQGAFDSAKAIFEVERTRAHRAGDAPAEGRAGMWLGLAAYRLGDYATARREGESALALKQRAGVDAELSQSFNALGLVAWTEGRLRDALRLYDSADASARRNDDVKGVARAAGNVGLVEFELGDYDDARRGFTAMLEAARVIGEQLYQGNALANLAMLEIRLGNPSAALPLLARARRHYAEVDYATGESNALGQLATAWSGLGDLQLAVAAADSGLAIARALGRTAGDRRHSRGAGRPARPGRKPAAGPRRVCARPTVSMPLLGLAVERGTNLRRSAAILLELGEAAPAVARAEGGARGSPVVEAGGGVYDRLQFALAAAASGDRRRAEAETDSALADAARLGNPAALRDAAMVAAQLALKAGHPREALTTCRRYPRRRPTIGESPTFAPGRSSRSAD